MPEPSPHQGQVLDLPTKFPPITCLVHLYTRNLNISAKYKWNPNRVANEPC